MDYAWLDLPTIRRLLKRDSLAVRLFAVRALAARGEEGARILLSELPGRPGERSTLSKLWPAPSGCWNCTENGQSPRCWRFFDVGLRRRVTSRSGCPNIVAIAFSDEDRLYAARGLACFGPAAALGGPWLWYIATTSEQFIRVTVLSADVQFDT